MNLTLPRFRCGQSGSNVQNGRCSVEVSHQSADEDCRKGKGGSKAGIRGIQPVEVGSVVLVVGGANARGLARSEAWPPVLPSEHRQPCNFWGRSMWSVLFTVAAVPCSNANMRRTQRARVDGMKSICGFEHRKPLKHSAPTNFYEQEFSRARGLLR